MQEVKGVKEKHLKKSPVRIRRIKRRKRVDGRGENNGKVKGKVKKEGNEKKNKEE